MITTFVTLFTKTLYICNVISDKDIAKKIASELLKINAVKFATPNTSFTWTSGWSSPIYCDNRIIFSYVATRDFLKQLFVDAIKNNYPDATVIAGVATGGIPMGALVADLLNLPFIYVRSSAKKHGQQNQIEGVVKKNDKVVVIEDLISTGRSSLKAVEALREQPIKILGLVAVFTYDFDVAVANFKAADVPFVTLTNYLHLLEQALDNGVIKSDAIDSLKKWREAPQMWQPNS